MLPPLLVPGARCPSLQKELIFNNLKVVPDIEYGGGRGGLRLLKKGVGLTILVILFGR